ncbi:MAG: HAD family hydrolase [Gammaproteobacteria bacterium]|nr:HAD family hydrolase [Gammaproteobacteria bacterium]
MTNFDLIVFDCDGVLVDSEPITQGVLAAMLNELGWRISLEQTIERFVGRLVRDELGNIERQIGRPLPADFLESFVARRNAALDVRVQPVAGIHDVLATLDLPFCVASGADRVKTELSLKRAGLFPLFDGRVFCGTEVPRTKPAPDIYFQAARVMGCAPERCAVVEDTATGVAAGVSAGMTVFGYAAANSSQPLLDAGAVVTFSDMRQLPRLLQ